MRIKWNVACMVPCKPSGDVKKDEKNNFLILKPTMLLDAYRDLPLPVISGPPESKCSYACSSAPHLTPRSHPPLQPDSPRKEYCTYPLLIYTLSPNILANIRETIFRTTLLKTYIVQTDSRMTCFICVYVRLCCCGCECVWENKIKLICYYSG